MSTNHNRIKVSDLETNGSNKILITNENGELTFSDASNLGLGASKFRKENFEFTGSKLFTLSEPALNVLAVVVDGITLNGTPGAPLQYRINTPTSLEILDEMIVGEDFWVSITYNYAGSIDGEQPGSGNYTADQIAETPTRKFQSFNQQAFNDATSSIQTQLNGKEQSILSGSSSQYFRGDKTWQTLDKAAVGLNNVNNTSDSAKNVLSATKLTTPTTINGVLYDGSSNITINAADSTARIASSEKGAANGVATLDANGIILTSQLPSYVDDVLEFTNLAGFPATGETGKIYIAKDTNKIYRWSGTAYIFITSGAVDSVAGKTGAVTLAKADVGLPNADNTADIAKNVLSATKLTTARTINGAAFDGSANITINATDSTARIASSEKGAANGVATLDANGIILTSQLPGYVDDVLEFTNLAGFPATGETGKIYIAKDTNKTYRWGGSSYVYITSGAVDSVAGKTGVVTLTKTDVGLGSVDNTADATKNVLSAAKLTTARTINGVSFDGSANITITDSTKENSIPLSTASQYWRGDKTWQPLSTANVPESSNLYFSNARSIASVLTGYSSSPGTISATDSVLSAINKLNGNIDLKAPLTSPVFTGTVIAPTFSGALAGNSSSATKLATARTINGVSFDGSTNITIADSTKLPLTGGTMSGDIVFPGTDRSEGIFGTYDSTKTQSIWSIGTAYRSSVDGSNFGTLYGLAYKHTNNTSGGTMAGGHQMVWCANGSPKSAIGDGIWTSGTITGDGSGLTGISQTFSIGGNAATATRLQTPRSINGVAFDGSANITIPINNTDKVPHQDGTRSDLNYNSALTSGFYNVNSTGTNGPGSAYNNLIVAKGIDTGLQIAGGHNNDSLSFRGWSSSGTTFTPWRQLLHSGNYNAYSPTLAGAGASGNWGINITGSAGGSSRLVDLLANRTDAAAYPVLWGVNQGTNPITGNTSTYAFSCEGVKIQSSTGTVIANNFSGNGTGLTGTASSLSIGGNAETATSTRRITFTDGPRTLSDRLPNTFARTVNFDFVNSAVIGGAGNYGGVMTFAPWDGNSASTGDSSYQLAFRNESGVNGSGLPGLRLRKGIDTTWGGWYDILHSGNYASFSAFSGAITGASLTVSGDVTAFSDARVKENIRPISNVIERIQASRGVVYDRIDNDQKDNIGFIAQELEENFPELVLTREDGTKAVKYQNAVAVLFEAVKKQQSQIEEQNQKMKLILEHLNLKL